MSAPSASFGFPTGGPRILLRAEGLALFAAATIGFGITGLSWWLYAVLFLAPDLSFTAYLGGSRTGAALYNAVHTTIGPFLLAGLGLWIDHPLLLGLAAVWLAHIGFDRVLGYGLKYASGFGHTHLGLIGPKNERA